jgi:hypothetical protein
MTKNIASGQVVTIRYTEIQLSRDKGGFSEREKEKKSFLTLLLCVADKLARLLLDVLGGAGALVDGLALLGATAVANLLDGLVALLHGLVEGLLLEGDLARLFKVLLANLFLVSVS